MHAKLKKFGRNEYGVISASAIILGVVGAVIGLIASLSTLETVVDAVSDINTTGWDFTGAEGAIALLGLVPFVYVAGVLLLSVGMVFVVASMAKKGD